ncbi:dTDP-4-dehydrorhamnose reductase [Streptomyces sp. YIM 130001]|uniref:dTDP-4-dehydrorhamnose reductase n=1 Tax=Streptomyces sp. YIM 130001 TaxID=2259644 RepID=UPI000E650F1F|nr:dTDP-4-dehydrorhamnose reductase [Streptomyces sp. YIM 130001]RII14261.1 dTDP-4-dehydrorhamnose reductase [Streptomyces sp. YIM 130001]
MIRHLVTGATGMLGSELCDRLAASGESYAAPARADLDLTDERSVRAAVRALTPDVVINCAAWTDVDGAESAEAEATRANGDAVRALARACADSGARLLHVSTDYVFAGDDPSPRAEDAPAAPRTAYGRSKLAGELAVLDELPRSGTVVRTAWMYGSGGRNFVTTMIAKARAGGAVRVVDDQHGQPTWARDVADRLLALAAGVHPGVFHATAAGRTTWYGLAREVYRRVGADPELVSPQSSADLQRAAVRPEFSVLSHDRWAAAGLAPPRPWADALAEAMPTLTDPAHPTDREGAAECAR